MLRPPAIDAPNHQAPGATCQAASQPSPAGPSGRGWPRVSSWASLKKRRTETKSHAWNIPSSQREEGST